MPEELQPPHGAFIATALVLTFVGLCLSFFLVHLFRKRTAETKAFTAPLVVGHLIAYTFFLYSWKSGQINESTIRAGLITLSAIPAFIVALSTGKPQIMSQPSAAENENSVEKEIEPALPEVNTPAEALQGQASHDEKPQTFSEGLARGVWAFVAIWIFYIFYLSFFGLVLRIASAASAQG